MKAIIRNGEKVTSTLQRNSSAMPEHSNVCLSVASFSRIKNNILSVCPVAEALAWEAADRMGTRPRPNKKRNNKLELNLTYIFNDYYYANIIIYDSY